MPPAALVLFDVNETLSDLAPMGQRFADVGLAPEQAALWFASVLRDGFALAAAGASAPFATIGAGVLHALLAAGQPTRPADDAVQHVLAGFSELPVHHDVPDGVRALRRAGLRLVTLTNGSTEVSQALLTSAGLRDAFERLLSVQDAGAWKPSARAYRYAAGVCEVEPAQMVLVAVHPWDVDGANRAGLSTAWLNRTGAPWPEHFRRPTFEVPALGDLPALLAPREAPRP